MISDGDRDKLIDHLVDTIDDEAGWHGYPASKAWLRDVIARAVDTTLIVERNDDAPIEELLERQSIVDLFAQPAPTVPQKPPMVSWTGAVRGPSGGILSIPGSLAAQAQSIQGMGATMTIHDDPIRDPTPEQKWDGEIAALKMRWSLAEGAGGWQWGPEHKDGIPFFDLAKPKKRHTCWKQTSGTNSSGSYVERCPCGAMRLQGNGDWMDRNTRPKGR